MNPEKERELERYVVSQCTWENLPQHIRANVEHNPKRWRAFVIAYSVQHQLPWRTTLVRTMIDEKAYYEELLQKSRLSLLLFPYHLSDVLDKVCHITPFKYYHEMMLDVMISERSYDALPNFTAADCVRLLSIGRNEFIDIMNRFRAKGWLLKKRRATIRSMLPPQTTFQEPDYWWEVAACTATEDDLRNLPEQEHQVLQQLSTGVKAAGELDKATVVSLYKKELVYITVPVNNTDHIAVPPLENFVMNRVLGDYFENLLYNVFVSINERTTVAQLAEVLQTDVENVKQAVSLYIMLGFAKNKSVEPLTFDASKGSKWHPSWLSHQHQLPQQHSETESTPDPVSAAKLPSDQPSGVSSTTLQPTVIDDGTEQRIKRIGFFFDSTLTAFLMMGNLGSGLKMHAVTMFEVGKLANEVMDDFLAELNKVKQTAEGDAQRYADHAIILRETLGFLRKISLPDCEGLDLLRCERINTLDTATKNRNYALLISMAPIAPDSQPVSTCTPLHFGPPIPEIESNWFRFYVYKISGCGPASILFPKGYIVRRLPTIFEGVQKLCIIPWDHEPIITNYGQALPVLNNRLKSKPVLVHAYSKCNSNPTFVDVPFPLPRESVDLLGNTTPTGPEETGFNSKNMHMHPAVIKLSHSLSLDHSCGYIRMINIPSDHSSAPTVPVQQPEALVDTAASTSQPHVPEKTVPTSTSATPTDANSWMPFSLHFGIPLFNLPLNRAVCERIQQQQLFSVENLASFSGWSRMLCLRLLDFIAQCQSPSIAPRGTGGNLSATSSLTTPLPLSSDSVVPFPTCPVLFHEGMLYKAQDVQYGN